MILAKADGYSPASYQLTVLDAEVLRLIFSENPVVENRTTPVVARLNRSDFDIAQPLTVTLASTNPSLASLPQTVVIPAGQSGIDVPITVFDNDTLGSGRVRIMLSAEGYEDVTSDWFNVEDFETLTVLVSPSSLWETDGPILVEVIRSNSNKDEPLQVDLYYPDAILSGSHTVVIPSGQSTVQVELVALDNRQRGRDRIVKIAAHQPDYQDAAAFVTIRDDESLWHSPRNALDVNDDKFITPFDFLLIVNWLNSHTNSAVDYNTPVDDDVAMFVDTSGDGFVSALDGLLVVNHLNSAVGSSGEDSRYDAAPSIDGETPFDIGDNRKQQKRVISSPAKGR